MNKRHLFLKEHPQKDKLIFRDVLIAGLSKEELLKELRDKGIGLNEFALKIIHQEKFSLSATNDKVQTMEISVEDLGFPHGANTHEVYQKAEEHGFRLCSPELGLYLRLQYIDLNQAIDPIKGNWQNIAITGPSDPEFSYGFYLRHREDGFWLRGYRVSHDYVWSPDDRFIFAM